MKIKELIEKLSAFDQDQMVVLSGYEGGVREASMVGDGTIALNVHDEWYYGPHDFVAMESDHQGAERIKAVYIS